MMNRPLPEAEENTTIDQLQITMAGQRLSLRQAAKRILHKPILNFGEEYLLLTFVQMSDEKKLSLQDIEYAFNNWATSRGADSMNYLKGIMNRIIDENNRQRLLHRAPTPVKLPEVVLDKDEAGRFLLWLRERHYKGVMIPKGELTAFRAEDVDEWYRRFKGDAIKEDQGG